MKTVHELVNEAEKLCNTSLSDKTIGEVIMILSSILSAIAQDQDINIKLIMLEDVRNMVLFQKPPAIFRDRVARLN